ncbi:hypothetical protein ACJJTC_001015 [Scirpophaga incertulas]
MSEEIEISEEERSVSENSPRDVNDSTYIYDSSSSHEDSNQSVCESDNESSLDSILENDAQNLDDLAEVTEPLQARSWRREARDLLVHVRVFVLSVTFKELEPTEICNKDRSRC